METYPPALEVQQSGLVLLWFNVLEATLSTEMVDKIADTQ